MASQTPVASIDEPALPPQQHHLPPQGPVANAACAQVNLPRITIQYCTQCNWLLRAAYYAQELLSTFSGSLGEVALVPMTGGIFTVSIQHASSADFTTCVSRIWDRKTDGGFPETKVLKSLVRNIVDPARDLGHVDRALVKDGKAKKQPEQQEKEEEKCQDCDTKEEQV
ncbi:hypothetical protein FQN57_002035 [Myotisia sp. PD_48]|nr:hypothetical protein FQN57_002035 [Myotisia sp. PD_48]